MKNFFNKNGHAEATSSPSQRINLPHFNEIDSITDIFGINVHAGSDYRVSIFNEGQENIKVDVVDQKLIIREKKSGSLKKHIYVKSPLIIVTVPKGALLTRIKINISAGSATLVQLTMQELDLDLLAGEANLTNVIVKKHTKAMLSAGKLQVTNCTLNIKGTLSAGSAMIEQLHGKNHLSLSTGSLTIVEDPTTSYDFSTSLGTIKYRGEKRGHHFRRTAPGSDELIVETSVGSIKIK